MFLSSLTHDARVLTPDIQPKNGTLELHLNRDCWEKGYTEVSHTNELHVADSRLHITGIETVTWHRHHPSTDTPWIDYLWIDQAYRRGSDFDCQIVGQDWQCTIRLRKETWAIRLEDQELPYLHSSRYPP